MSPIVPAILEQTKEGFADKVSRVVKLPGVERIHVDFADNVFVPNKTLDVSDIDALNPAFHWEAHLMIDAPTDFLDYQICGFKTIVVHYEAYKLPTKLKLALQSIKAQGMEPAICIKPGTDVNVLKDFANEVNHFQLMGLEPGFQGKEFLEETYERIAELRKLLPNAIIEADGGVNLINVKKVILAGADMVVVGSALSKANDMATAYEQLETEINKN